MKLPESIASNLEAVRDRIKAAEQKYGRQPESVQLLAVSKTKPIPAILDAFSAGQLDFGENYLQDAVTKIAAVDQSGLRWHFIGPVQSNKSRDIATYFQWLHSLDRIKIARRLSQQRSASQPPLNVCVQVNTSGEQSKSGVAPAATAELANEVAQLPNLRLRGLMTIPAPAATFAAQRQPFRLLRELLEELNSQGHQLDTLSMGMSGDLEAAIAEGSTMVRVGTAIFGERH